MPIYVYECEQCSNRFEYTQSLSEPPKTVCESCGGKLTKVIVPIAFHLKGGGWSKDLYASSKSGSSKSEAKSGSTTEAKSDTKTSGGGDK